LEEHAGGRSSESGQLNRSDERVSACDWFRLALGTDGSMVIYRTITRVNAWFRRIPARLVADRIAEMLVKIRLAGKMNTPRT
jgi:hypothetical protein